ncbi:uncharacterized protein E0L32_001658 [Thyridium curvatum]|uniref:60S ribosomal export protein NMD3 n=1 Tax=Thyridium curvatum TaxID=1093900 RepID=A0A507AWJ3_9PEZI|nr:uncharacterized protein E0L32_001540 [Thyridium curvatum]XP_030990909.1 uncharacterized protein E0L32_001658 [Thyridium curvatum]TPX09080.1 hypothetical protein E0L32_001540 [Thyridium curvatum]TPX09198.1 hypothetical protein E0L32_001658 [Thyridium curvatum]
MEKIDAFRSFYSGPENVHDKELFTEVFREAMQAFQSELSKDSTKVQWLYNSRLDSLEEVLSATVNAQAQYESQKDKSTMRRTLVDLSKKIHYYGKVLDVMVQHHPEYVSLVWGAMKVLFVGVVNHQNLLSTLAGALCQIADILPRVELSIQLYSTSYMKQIVVPLYTSILKFLVRALRWYQESRTMRAIHAITRPAELCYNDIIAEISSLSQRLSELALVSGLAEQRDLHTRLRLMHLDMTRLRDVVLQMKDSMAAEQVINASARIEFRQQLTSIQVTQFVDILSKAPLLDPLKSLESSVFLRKRRRHISVPYSLRFWFTTEMQNWNQGHGSGFVMIDGTWKLRHIVRDFCTDSIMSLQEAKTPVIWALKPADFPQQADSQVWSIDILKILIAQAIRLNLTIQTDSELSPRLRACNTAMTYEEWLQILASVLQNIPYLYMFIDLELVSHPMDDSKRSWPRAIQRVLAELSQRGCGCVIKVALISYGSHVFTTSAIGGDAPPVRRIFILCCNCSAPIDGTTSANALCYDCIKLTVDISQGIPREANIQFCKDCDRWLLPPNSWVVAAPESREMLALCLKKLRGLNKVRVIDASFIWTEPNSRRVRVKLTIQDSVAEGVVLQQSFEVVYVVGTHQCPECQKSYTANVWRACVQVRQKVLHKRTFLFLEQLIMKHGAHRDTLNIKEAKDGIDFYFSQRNQAVKFVDFLKSVVPVFVKNSPELISEDIHTSTKSMKFAFSVDIVPICKDDLVALPLELAKRIGNISPICLCWRIGTSVNLLDPQTLTSAEIAAPIYWREKHQFGALADMKELVEFVVLDIEPTGYRKGKWVLAEATVARASDMGANDTTYFTRTHLGHMLQVGDSAMGYLLTGTNFNSAELDAIEESHAYGSTIPDVVLVKKHWPRKQKNRKRHWRLKRMAKDEGELLPKKSDQARMDAEYETFLRDVEEDDELRAALALYKNTNKKKLQQQQGGMDVDSMSVAGTEMTEDVDGDDAPRVDMEELLDDFDELAIEDQQ